MLQGTLSEECIQISKHRYTLSLLLKYNSTTLPSASNANTEQPNEEDEQDVCIYRETIKP